MNRQPEFRRGIGAIKLEYKRSKSIYSETYFNIAHAHGTGGTGEKKILFFILYSVMGHWSGSWLLGRHASWPPVAEMELGLRVTGHRSTILVGLGHQSVCRLEFVLLYRPIRYMSTFGTFHIDTTLIKLTGSGHRVKDFRVGSGHGSDV